MLKDQLQLLPHDIKWTIRLHRLRRISQLLKLKLLSSNQHSSKLNKPLNQLRPLNQLKKLQNLFLTFPILPQFHQKIGSQVMKEKSLDSLQLLLLLLLHLRQEYLSLRNLQVLLAPLELEWCLLLHLLLPLQCNKRLMMMVYLLICEKSMLWKLKLMLPIKLLVEV